jgi:hypothetical protein
MKCFSLGGLSFIRHEERGRRKKRGRKRGGFGTKKSDRGELRAFHRTKEK